MNFDHSSQGVTTYRYNHANQRIYMKTGTKISYFLDGPGGERLLEMEEQCGGNCWNYQETQRWIDAAGFKMFQKAGTTLKAITPNRLASEAKHFPYGETDGPPPSDTKDYFATYRRDTTGLDYAWNRYYSPTMGRFTTADPYGGSADPRNSASWNRYSYVLGDPVNSSDANGLLTIYVPGTELRPWGRADGEYAQPGTPFHTAMSKYFGEDVIVMDWRGQPYSRESGMNSLLNMVRNHEFKEGEKLNIVGFSHGGNIIKDYTWQIGARKIDTLITMGTPQRWDYRVNGVMVGTYLNVYSKYDLVQPVAGYSFWGGVLGGLYGGVGFGWPGAVVGIVAGVFAGRAGRTDRCAVNIGIDQAPGLGTVGHSEIHTAEVWNQMEFWLLRAGHGLHPVDLSYCQGGGGSTPMPISQPGGEETRYFDPFDMR